MFGVGACACHCGYCRNDVLLEHGAGSPDAPSTRPPASVRACRQTSARRCPPCRRNRRHFSPEPAPVECVQLMAIWMVSLAECQPWWYPFFYSSGAVVYRTPAIEVAHHLHNLFYTLGGIASSSLV